MVQSPKRTAPGPRAWPLLGNVGAMRGLVPFLEEQWTKHGDVFRVRILGFSALMVAHPDQIQRVLIGNRHNYMKGTSYDGVRKIIGQGLVTLEGEAWKERRTLVQPAFHRHALEKLAASMVDSGALFFDALDARIGIYAKDVDIHAEMVRLTLDVVIAALFGRGTLESSEISYQALAELLELLSEGVNGVQLPAWVPTPRNRKFQRTMRSLDRNVAQILQAARARDEPGTLLSMLLQARDEQGEPLNDLQLRDEIITLFIAGHETTALTLTWLFALLDGHPQVLTRMRAEVDTQLGGQEPSFATVPKLSYLRQVIDETLRLRPPAMMVARNAVGDDDLGGYPVKPGDAVLPYFWGAHRHRDFWQDPDRFDPDRFTPAAVKSRPTSAYVPFAAGPRVCIGNSFALMESVLLLAQLLQRFDVEILPAADVKPVAIATVRPSRPIRVRLARRPRKAS